MINANSNNSNDIFVFSFLDCRSPYEALLFLPEIENCCRPLSSQIIEGICLETYGILLLILN